MSEKTYDIITRSERVCGENERGALEGLRSSTVRGHSFRISNYLQDMCCQLHLQGVHTVDTLKPTFTQGNQAAFPGWTDIPQVIFMCLQVPRRNLEPLEHVPLDQLGTPLLRCNIIGPQHLNSFAVIQAAFGAVISSARPDQEPDIVLEEDIDGWGGKADLVVHFALPSWFLSTETRVSFGIRETLASIDLTSVLNPALSIYETTTTDRQHVFFTRSPLRATQSKSILTSISYFAHTPTPSPTNHTGLALDSDVRKITQFTIRVIIEDPREQAILESPERVGVTYQQNTPCGLVLKFDKVERHTQFPFPIDGTRIKLRIARKSHYIEVSSLPPLIPIHKLG